MTGEYYYLNVSPHTVPQIRLRAEVHQMYLKFGCERIYKDPQTTIDNTLTFSVTPSKRRRGEGEMMVLLPGTASIPCFLSPH